MRNLDFSSWQNLLSTLLALCLVTLIGVGVRLLAMSTVQQRRERANRQINERLRLLIAAYKTLGGSFTGELTVDPTHLRDLRRSDQTLVAPPGMSGSDRSRRIRDAVEAALSDIILLGTEEQVRLAEQAVRELVANRHVHTHDLVVSLRNFIREALDLDPIPSNLALPRQGPSRSVSSSQGRQKAGGEEGGRSEGSSRGKAGAGEFGAGMGMGGMAGVGVEDSHPHDDPTGDHR